MTWFLSRAEAAEDAPIEGPPTGFVDQVVAGFRRTAIDIDFWDYGRRVEQDYRDELIDQVGGREAIVARRTGRAAQGNPNFVSPREVMSYIQTLDPAARGALPADMASYEAEVLRRRKAESDEVDALLARGDSPAAQFIGGMGAAASDPLSLALMPFGGPLTAGGRITLSSFARFVGAEAALGGVGEALSLPREFQVAEELDRPAPDPLSRIGLGIVSGGVLGGAIGGVARGVEYLRTRTAGENAALAEGSDPLAHESGINAAEKALRAGSELPAVTPDAPANWEQIRNGIFAGESGGDYNALFGFSNRPGGPFENVKLTEMTVDEAIAFSAPSGAYAQWVNAQIGRIATPMGGYQIVGTTLRAAKTGLGLTGSEKMTADLQERLGQWIYRAQGTGAWVGYRGPRDDFTPTGEGATYSGGAPRGIRRGQTGDDEVTTPAGRKVRVQYEVVDLSKLQPATGDLQPRDRSRAASDDQIRKIAAELDPARLMPGPESDRGAPVIGPDGVIESGNGRVRALLQAVEQNPQGFRGYVDEIRRQGFDIPEGIAVPGIVARRTSDLSDADRVAFVRENNTSAVARMSAPEQARFDAGFLSQRAFDAFVPGRRIAGPENAGFVRRVFDGMTAEERAAMIGPDGAMNVEGLRRIRAALFARAFDADDLLALAVESENRAVMSIVRMLEDLAPQWAAFRAQVEAGYVRPEFDVTAQLMDAVRIIAKARAEGREGQSVIAAVRDALAQGDMFAARDPMVEAMVDVFYKGDRARSPQASGEILERYAAEAALVGRADMVDLTDAASPADVLTRAIAAHEGAEPFAPLPQRAAPAVDPDPVEVSAIDPGPMSDGTANRAVQAADDALEAELRVETAGTFGPIYDGFTDNPEGAIAKLMAEGRGEVPDAVVHPELGPIAFVYGKLHPDRPERDYGLIHILQKHGQEMLDTLPAAIRAGTVTFQGNGRAYLDVPGSPLRRTVVKLEWDGVKKRLVVSSHNRNSEGSDARQVRTTDEPPASAPSRVPGTTGQNKGNATPPAPQATRAVQSAVSDAPSAAGRDMPEPANATTPIADAIAAARETLPGDMSVTIGQGTEAEQTVTLSQALDNLQAERAMEDVLVACGIGRAPA